MEKVGLVGGRGGHLVESSLFEHTRGTLLLYLLLFKSECFPKNDTRTLQHLSQTPLTPDAHADAS